MAVPKGFTKTDHPRGSRAMKTVVPQTAGSTRRVQDGTRRNVGSARVGTTTNTP